MNKVFGFILSCFMLSSCADTESKSETDSVTETTTVTTTVTTAVTTTTTTVPEQKTSAETKTITAEVTDYTDDTLYFTYEGKDYALPMDDKKFFNNFGNYRDGREPTLSERIIKNRFGEKVIGKIVLSADMTKIIKCDVVSPNGEEYEGIPSQYYNDKDQLVIDPGLYYSFKKTSPRTGMVYNSAESIEFELNDLAQYGKLYYKDEIVYVSVQAYKFKSGNLIMTSVSGPLSPQENGLLALDRTRMRTDYIHELCYFGTVTKNENDMADVLLNDGISTITAPSYFNDGEVKAGERVMVMAELAEEKLYGTGGHLTLDRAVFFTREKYYNYTFKYFLKYEDIDNFAYATNGDDNTSELVYYSKDTLKKKRQWL